MDALSADLLELLARAVAALPVLVVLTYRPGSLQPPEARAHDGRRARAASTLRRARRSVDRSLAERLRPRRDAALSVARAAPGGARRGEPLLP